MSGPAKHGEMVAVMFWYGAHWAFWQAGLMWAGILAFWGLLIWGVYALISAATRKSGRVDQASGARCILDERLARGEIDADVYRRLRDMIDSCDTDTSAGAGRTSARLALRSTGSRARRGSAARAACANPRTAS